MGWKENRRRKRRWYKKFDAIAVALIARVSNQQATVTMADILKLFYQFAVVHRLFKYNWIKESAAESLLLVAKDRALDNIQVTGQMKVSARGPSPLTGAYRDFTESSMVVQAADRTIRLGNKPVYDMDLPKTPAKKEPEVPF